MFKSYLKRFAILPSGWDFNERFNVCEFGEQNDSSDFALYLANVCYYH